MEAAVADRSVRCGGPAAPASAQRGSAAVTEAAAGEPDIASGLVRRCVPAGWAVSDGLIDDDVAGDSLSFRSKTDGWRDGAGCALAAEAATRLCRDRRRARRSSRDPRADTLAPGVVGARLDHVEHLLQDGRAVARMRMSVANPHASGNPPSRDRCRSGSTSIAARHARRIAARTARRSLAAVRGRLSGQWRQGIDAGIARRIQGILRSMELNSATRMPQVRASRSSSATAFVLRPR